MRRLSKLSGSINGSIREYKEHNDPNIVYSSMLDSIRELEIDSENNKIGVFYDNNLYRPLLYIAKPEKKLIKRNKLGRKGISKSGTLNLINIIIDDEILPGNRLNGKYNRKSFADLRKYGLIDSQKLLFPIVSLDKENVENIENLVNKSVENKYKNPEQNPDVVVIKKYNQPIIKRLNE